jgi:hypothetical protein
VTSTDSTTLSREGPIHGSFMGGRLRRMPSPEFRKKKDSQSAAQFVYCLQLRTDSQSAAQFVYCIELRADSERNDGINFK